MTESLLRSEKQQEVVISAEKCKKCEKIFTVDSDHSHRGIVSTQSDQHYCTLDCLNLDSSKVF